MKKDKIRQLGGEGPPARHLLLIERDDGTFSFYEDTTLGLSKYKPRKGETVSRHRAFVRLP